MPSKSQSPRAAARAAARAATATAAAAAESLAISQVPAQDMLVKGFGIELGDTDEAVREKGVKKMLVWLRAQREVSELNMQKIWKALLFNYWMSDRRPVRPPPPHHHQWSAPLESKGVLCIKS